MTTWDRVRSVAPLHASVDGGHLSIGKHSVAELAAIYGTPLYLFDEQHLRDRCRAYRSAFDSFSGGCTVVYASKAFACTAMLKLAREEGLGADVASAGELAI